MGEERSRNELSVNKQKTEVMRLTKRREQVLVNINLEGRRLDQVKPFRCFGSLMNDDRKCDSVINSRIAMEKAGLDR